MAVVSSIYNQVNKSRMPQVCRVWAKPTGMNKEESKVKVGINYGKSFLKVSPKKMVNY